jgi:hypothetical protein
MAKIRKPKKDKHHNGQKPQTKERQTLQWPKAVSQTKANITMAAIVMFAFLWFTAFGHCDVCLSLDYGSWPL